MSDDEGKTAGSAPPPAGADGKRPPKPARKALPGTSRPPGPREPFTLPKAPEPAKLPVEIAAKASASGGDEAPAPAAEGGAPEPSQPSGPPSEPAPIAEAPPLDPRPPSGPASQPAASSPPVASDVPPAPDAAAKGSLTPTSRPPPRVEPDAPTAAIEPKPESSLDASVDSLVPESPGPASVEPEPHRKVGRCELFSEIGHGGMATVFLGRWVGAGGFAKTVAVKALHRQYARDDEFVKMFLDEARVVARIRHPNVMPTIDLVDEEGELFIVMDYVEGVTLAHLMRQMRRLKQLVPVEMSLRIATGVLHGLHAAHQAKNPKGEPLCVIHRDVSPENILVGVDGYARLIDFGIASALGRHSDTRAGQVKGKTSYLTPEQVRGDPLGPPTDVFSAASVLWQALVGRRLFKAKNLGEITYKILNADIEAPSVHRPELDKRYDRIVLRGLERETTKRWQTAQQMAEALEAAGGQASHRQVGDWVCKVAAERLERTAVLLEAVENAPMEGPESELDRPLSIRTASRASIPEDAYPPLEVWGISEEDDTSADLAEEGDEPPAPDRKSAPWAKGGLGLLALALLGYLGDDAGAPPPRPDAPPASAAPAVPVQPTSLPGAASSSGQTSGPAAPSAAAGGGGAGGSAGGQPSASTQPAEGPPTASKPPKGPIHKPVDPDLPDDI
ncbi:MAG: protein kinase [Deltaproteobacteria bacterium]|nr:protein kinase [Deltaproteobacteria bacterium]